MQGKLMTKSKVIQTMRPKSQVFKRRIKPERANTPQRWSRRIRSLPPIPINVLKPRRKIRKKSTSAKQERYTSTSFIEVGKKSIHQKVNRQRRSVFVNKNASNNKAESVEVFRIVPVVVYVKNPVKPNKAFVPEEIRVHINDNPTCQMVSQAIDSHIHKKINQEQENIHLGKRYSRRIMTAHHNNHMENKVQATKRKYPSRKKLLLYQ